MLMALVFKTRNTKCQAKQPTKVSYKFEEILKRKKQWEH